MDGKIGRISALSFFCVASMTARAAFLVDEGQQPVAPVAISKIAPSAALPVSVAPSAPPVLPKTPSETVGRKTEVFMDGVPEPAGQRINIKLHVIHVGTPGNFGSSVTVIPKSKLSFAVSALAPRGWDVTWSADVDGNMRVDHWGEYGNWVAALNAVLIDTSYFATIDWNRQSVFVNKLADISAKASIIGGGKNQPVLDVSRREPFVLNAGSPMSQQVTKWAERAGWSLKWDLTNDWTVQGDTQFGLDFKKAISAVVENASENGADIRADIYDGNKTVVIHASNK